jgi:D-alanyl-D-alanine carboxypeptidase (penicillin-binding protein 5/6)
MQIRKLIGALVIVLSSLLCLAGCGGQVAPVNKDVTQAYVANLWAGQSLNLSQVKSKSLILLAKDSGQVLAARQAQAQTYPASLTKIMTAVIVTDKLTDLQEEVAVPGDFFDYLNNINASVAGFKAGEKVKVIDLLYGVLLPSGAECSLTLARKVAGSEKDFATLMNAKALALGMTGTHYVNPTGLHDPLQYTTAADVAKLLKYAWDRPILRQMMTTKYYKSSPTKEHPQGLRMRERIFALLREQARLRNAAANLPAPSPAGLTGLSSGAISPTAEILGGKTGATGDAGLCLASVAKIHGREYILVTTAAMGNIYVDRFHVTDALNIYGQLDKALD